MDAQDRPQIKKQPEDSDSVKWEAAFREMSETGEETIQAEPPRPAAPRPAPGKTARTPAAAPASTESAVDIDFLLDIPLDVTVEVGRTKMMIHDLLQLQQGSVIDLEKTIGEPFEVYVNRKLIAFGEVVVVNEKFGIRLTDIIDPKERIQQLG